MTSPVLNLTELQQALEDLNRDAVEEWTLVGGRLSRSFSFADFVTAFGFMTRVAIYAEKMNHHPDWSNVYSTVNVSLYTHEAGGITRLDFALAQQMERLARD
jgi:4a-hydroxytetrahydrobiopterin dehydratase